MLSERERRQLDDIEHDLRRDPDFAATIEDILASPAVPPGPRARVGDRIVVRLMVTMWLMAIMASTVSQHYLLAGVLIVLAATSYRIRVTHGRRLNAGSA